MNKILFVICCLLAYTAKAQQISTFKQAPSKNIVITQLDSVYAPAVGDSMAVFAADEEKLIQAYTTFVQGFGQLLLDSNFVWPPERTGEIRGFNRIYFNADGSVAYWVYSLKKLELSESQQLQFERLLLLYCQTTKLKLASATKQKFVQCAPVLYRQ
ncbi:MAG: hypothetical protein ACRCYO_07445 [Bacteroidia bacterium]